MTRRWGLLLFKTRSPWSLGDQVKSQAEQVNESDFRQSFQQMMMKNPFCLGMKYSLLLKLFPDNKRTFTTAMRVHRPRGVLMTSLKLNKLTKNHHHSLNNSILFIRLVFGWSCCWWWNRDSIKITTESWFCSFILFSSWYQSNRVVWEKERKNSGVRKHFTKETPPTDQENIS